VLVPLGADQVGREVPRGTWTHEVHFADQVGMEVLRFARTYEVLFFADQASLTVQRKALTGGPLH